MHPALGFDGQLLSERRRLAPDQLQRFGITQDQLNSVKSFDEANKYLTQYASGAAAAERDGATAAEAALRWASGDAVVLGGDFNLRAPEWPGFARVGGHDVDHVFIAGPLQARSTVQVLDRGALSDHAPVAVALRLLVGESGESGEDPDV